MFHAGHAAICERRRSHASTAFPMFYRYLYFASLLLGIILSLPMLPVPSAPLPMRPQSLMPHAPFRIAPHDISLLAANGARRRSNTRDTAENISIRLTGIFHDDSRHWPPDDDTVSPISLVREEDILLSFQDISRRRRKKKERG